MKRYRKEMEIYNEAMVQRAISDTTTEGVSAEILGALYMNFSSGLSEGGPTRLESLFAASDAAASGGSQSLFYTQLLGLEQHHRNRMLKQQQRQVEHRAKTQQQVHLPSFGTVNHQIALPVHDGSSLSRIMHQQKYQYAEQHQNQPILVEAGTVSAIAGPEIQQSMQPSGFSTLVLQQLYQAKQPSQPGQIHAHNGLFRQILSQNPQGATTVADIYEYGSSSRLQVPHLEQQQQVLGQDQALLLSGINEQQHQQLNLDALSSPYLASQKMGSDEVGPLSVQELALQQQFSEHNHERMGGQQQQFQLYGPMCNVPRMLNSNAAFDFEESQMPVMMQGSQKGRVDASTIPADIMDGLGPPIGHDSAYVYNPSATTLSHNQVALSSSQMTVHGTMTTSSVINTSADPQGMTTFPQQATESQQLSTQEQQEARQRQLLPMQQTGRSMP